MKSEATTASQMANSADVHVIEAALPRWSSFSDARFVLV